MFGLSGAHMANLVLVLIIIAGAGHDFVEATKKVSGWKSLAAAFFWDFALFATTVVVFIETVRAVFPGEVHG